MVASVLDDGGEPVILTGLDDFRRIYGERFGTAGEDIAEGGTGTVVLDRPGTRDRVDDGGSDGISGWFCIRRDPFRCGGCDQLVAHHDDSYHRIVVYPAENDPNMLWKVDEMDERGQHPKVVEYERALGDSVSFYELCPS